MGTITIITTVVSITILASFVGVGVFFFSITRGALLVRSWFGLSSSSTSHIYPVYSERWLIKVVDFQPLISAILLFQYEKIVSRIVTELRQTALIGKKVLITSCAFGNVIPRIVRSSIECGAERVIITDIIVNELFHVKEKIETFADKIEFSEENAICMKQKNESVAVNVIFFLLHELPHNLKNMALHEAGRVLVPGGKLIIAEFHRPSPIFLRILSRVYFKVFEPYAHAIWDSYDPVSCLEKEGQWTCEKTTYFYNNFQVIIATKKVT